MSGRIASHRPVVKVTVEDKGYIASHRDVAKVTVEDKGFIASSRAVAKLAIEDKGFIASHYVLAKLTAVPFGQIASHIILVKVAPSPIPETIDGSLKPIRDAVVDLADSVATNYATWRALLASGEYSDRNLGEILTEITGYLQDIKDIRTDLDPKVVTDYLTQERGDDFIRLWIWEKDVRLSLSKMARALLDLEESVTKLLKGEKQKLYIVKLGDTLQSIAARYMADWQNWPQLAEANGLTPGPVDPGTVLIIPEVK